MAIFEWLLRPVIGIGSFNRKKQKLEKVQNQHASEL